jgi:Ion channel
MDPARRERRRESWLERAERVRDAFGLVLASVMLTYVLASLVANKGWGAVVLCIATSATSLIALTSAHARPRLFRTALYLSGVTVLLAAIGAAAGDKLWLNVATVVQVALLTVAMAAVLQRVVTSERVGSRTILGALSVYAVLGILFTFVYGFVERVQGGAFFEGHPHPAGGDFLFFSYTTLTTTGYGNLVPGGQPGRMISGLEMMIGQIFLVTLVAGLVSLWRPGEGIKRRQEARRERRAGAEAPPEGDAPAAG